MFNLIDVIVLAVILIMGFVGYKMGFVKTIISLLSFFIAVGIALAFYKPLAVILTEKTDVDEWIIEKVVHTRIDSSGDMIVLTEENEVELQETLPVETKEEKESVVKGILEELPNNIISSLSLKEARDNAKVEFANKLSELIMKLFSLIIIFLVVKVTLLIATFIIDGIMKLPVLKQVNEVLGLTIGVILGFIEMYVVFAVITFISSIADISFVVVAIKSSAFASIMFENNLIIKLLS